MNESLHESAHFMKMGADFMPGMVGYWTRDLRSTFANREYLNWFGKSPEEMRGVPVQDLLGGELFRKHEPYIRAALAGQPQKFDYPLAWATIYSSRCCEALMKPFALSCFRSGSF
jgi:PAS domain-containing protein